MNNEGVVACCLGKSSKGLSRNVSESLLLEAHVIPRVLAGEVGVLTHSSLAVTLPAALASSVSPFGSLSPNSARRDMLA